MAEIATLKTPAETALARSFESLKGKLPGDAKPREEAFGLFAERGLPHRRVEEFKYTDLRALMRDAAPLAAKPDAARAKAAVEGATAFAEVDAVRVTLVDGHFSPEDSDLGRLPAGVEVAPLAEAMASGHLLLRRLGPVEWTRVNPVYQLNTAFMTDGAVIRIAAGTQVEGLLHLRFVTASETAVATATRVLVVVEDGASVTIAESHESGGAAHQPNDAVEVIVGEGASVRHVRLNREGPETVALSTLAVELGAKATFDTFNAVAGSLVSRHQVFVVFAGDHAVLNVNGTAMLNGRQHADSTLVVDHAALHGVSRELFKTVVDGEATGVFQGKIIVQPHAQKTDGRMMSGCLLLSDGGTMNNKPELEIFADDVQCAHGATVGALDEDLLFYLMSRGVPKAQAESLLVQAFVGEAIEGVEHEGLRDALIVEVEGWLAARG